MLLYITNFLYHVFIIMKLLLDFFPVILFFIIYKWFGIYPATAATIGACFIQVGYHYYRYQKIEALHIITLLLVAVLGSATLFWHNELFIKWKPTAVNWAFALAFLISPLISDKPLIQRVLENNLQLPKPVWLRLNLSWAGFFILLGIANLYVIYHFNTNTWVNFKLFGMLGLTVLFVIFQGVYLSKFLKLDNE